VGEGNVEETFREVKILHFCVYFSLFFFLKLTWSCASKYIWGVCLKKFLQHFNLQWLYRNKKMKDGGKRMIPGMEVCLCVRAQGWRAPAGCIDINMLIFWGENLFLDMFMSIFYYSIILLFYYYLFYLSIYLLKRFHSSIDASMEASYMKRWFKWLNMNLRKR
jgi:hypothetical protein